MKIASRTMPLKLLCVPSVMVRVKGWILVSRKFSEWMT